MSTSFLQVKSLGMTIVRPTGWTNDSGCPWRGALCALPHRVAQRAAVQVRGVSQVTCSPQGCSSTLPFNCKVQGN